MTLSFCLGGWVFFFFFFRGTGLWYILYEDPLLRGIPMFLLYSCIYSIFPFLFYLLSFFYSFLPLTSCLFSLLIRAQIYVMTTEGPSYSGRRWDRPFILPGHPDNTVRLWVLYSLYFFFFFFFTTICIHHPNHPLSHSLFFVCPKSSLYFLH